MLLNCSVRTLENPLDSKEIQPVNPKGRVSEVAQLCPTLCDPVDCSQPGSSVRGILQAIILEWIVMPSPRGSSQSRERRPIAYISCIAMQALYH